MLPFQSLTGSIHTDGLDVGRFVDLGFNPSQVQFTPIEDFENLVAMFQFQSLTGSIHTCECRLLPASVGYVSIPHRFNSHGKTIDERVKELVEFQSLTGSIHTEKVRTILIGIYLFQSLTGSIHTLFSHQFFSQPF